MKGPSEKGDQFAVLEYMKGGQMVTHPCAPLPRIEFCTHTMRARMCVSAVVCVARKLCPCPSYSKRRDRNNCVHWRIQGGAGYNFCLSSSNITHSEGEVVWYNSGA